jgi:hypothetical protein
MVNKVISGEPANERALDPIRMYMDSELEGCLEAVVRISFGRPPSMSRIRL